MLKLTTDRHEASRGLFVTAELLAHLILHCKSVVLRIGPFSKYVYFPLSLCGSDISYADEANILASSYKVV